MWLVPSYRVFDWQVSILSDSLLLLIGKTNSTKTELSERESELIDFFQKAPISLVSDLSI